MTTYRTVFGSLDKHEKGTIEITRDLQRAHRIAAAIRTGMVWINCYKRVNPGSPFGGVASSGCGREMGFEAMHDYTEAKSVWVNVDAKIPPYYPRG